MKEDKLEKLLRQAPDRLERNPDCPDESRLAAYFEGGLNEAEHRDLGEHFADCDYCLERLGVLGRCRESDSDVPVPELLAARARRLVPEPARAGRMSRRAPVWAAAALLVLTLGLVFNLRGPGSVDGPQPEFSAPAAPTMPLRETRYIEPLAGGPTLLWPKDGESIRSTALEFRWTAVPGALYYDLRIVSDLGDLVLQKRVNDSRWRPSTPLPLQSGSEYFVRIDAWVGDTGALSSDFVPFHYGAQD
jgi:hypothetical protein